MGRLGDCSNVHETLKSCAQVTANEDKEQYLLYKFFKAWNNKITLPHKISNKAKFSKYPYTPGTLKSCAQVTSRVKHTVLVSGTVQSLVKL